MEESSNGKIEEIQKVETEEEGDRAVIKDVEELKSEVESVRENIVDGNSESLKESQDGNNCLEGEAEVKVSSPLVKDSGNLEEVQKEINSIVESVESVVPFPQELSSTEEASIEESNDSDVIEVGTKETEENNVAADGMLNGTKKTIFPPSTSNEIDGSVPEVVLDRTEEIKLPSSDDKDGSSAIATDIMSKGVEENVLPSLDENVGVPSVLTEVVSKGIEEVTVGASEDNNGESDSIVDKESAENDSSNQSAENDLSKLSTNATIVASSDAFPDGKENPHVISLSHRTVQPTSWRSCCGLFEALGRSNR